MSPPHVMTLPTPLRWARRLLPRPLRPRLKRNLNQLGQWLVGITTDPPHGHRKHDAYAQYGEDRLIVEYFGSRVGRFLDLSAGDGETFSNTLLLFERGWGGVVIDGDPTQLNKLLERYQNNERVRIVGAFVTLDHCGLAPVYLSNIPYVTTLQPEWVGKMKRATYTSVTAATCTVDDLLTNCPGPYEFVNIDVEGLSIPMARAVAERVLPEMLCVEHEGEPERVLAELTPLGYKMHATVEGNILFVRAP